jgi:hypothetical protein
LHIIIIIIIIIIIAIMEDNNQGSANPRTRNEDTAAAPPINSSPAASGPPSSIFIDDPQSVLASNNSNTNTNTDTNTNTNTSSGVAPGYLARWQKRITQYLSLKYFRRIIAVAVGRAHNKVDDNPGKGIWAPADMMDVIIGVLLVVSIVLGVLVYWRYYCRIGSGSSINVGAGAGKPCEHSVILVTAPLRSWISTYENAGLAFVQQWSGTLNANGECDCREPGGRLTRGEVA